MDMDNSGSNLGTLQDVNSVVRSMPIKMGSLSDAMSATRSQRTPLQITHQAR